MKPISPPSRYPCGKKRPTTAQRQTDASRAEADAMTRAARAQPHRRAFGDNADSPLACCPLGRFVLTHRLRVEFYDAAEEWAKVRTKWLNAQPDAPRLPGDRGAAGGDTPWEVIHEWGNEWTDGWRMMQEYGGADGALSVWRMALHWEEFAPGASVEACVKALAAIALQRGKIDIKLFKALVGY